MPFRSHVYEPRAKIDISESKLLGFETCAIFLGFRSQDFCQFLECFGVGKFGTGKKSRFRFRSQDFCQFLEGFGIGFGDFGLGKKVSVLVLENFVSEKSLGFGQNFGLVIK